MQIETLKVGYLQTNCYILTKANKTIIIDPGDEIEKILKASENKNIVGILVTHHHFDHIGALKELEQRFLLKHNPEKIEGFNYQMISSPGHTKDSQIIFFKEENILFSGDFIFYHTIGRWDLDGGDFSEMQQSIKEILKWHQNPIIYPGHGQTTTLKEEISYLRLYIEKN